MPGENFESHPDAELFRKIDRTFNAVERVDEIAAQALAEANGEGEAEAVNEAESIVHDEYKVIQQLLDVFEYEYRHGDQDRKEDLHQLVKRNLESTKDSAIREASRIFLEKIENGELEKRSNNDNTNI